MISLLGCVGVPLPTSMGVRSCCSARMVGGGHPTAPAISPNRRVCVGGGDEVWWRKWVLKVVLGDVLEGVLEGLLW